MTAPHGGLQPRAHVCLTLRDGGQPGGTTPHPQTIPNRSQDDLSSATNAREHTKARAPRPWGRNRSSQARGLRPQRQKCVRTGSAARQMSASRPSASRPQPQQNTPSGVLTLACGEALDVPGSLPHVHFVTGLDGNIRAPALEEMIRARGGGERERHRPPILRHEGHRSHARAGYSTFLGDLRCLAVRSLVQGRFPYA